MTEADFDDLRRFLKARSGLDLGPEKRYLAETRLLPVCRDRGYASLGALVRELRRPGAGELRQAVGDAMATNETSFFRDRGPFEALRDTVLPRLADARRGGRRLRVWSAACSTGQEPYSLAMLLGDMGAAFAGWRVSILATDLSASAIARAQTGLYSQFEVQRGLPIRHLLRHFIQADGGWQVSPELRASVEFRIHNLLSGDALGRFDLILCRNVLIYLDGPTKAALLRRLADALTPGGVLCLGGSESALGHEAILLPHPAARGFFLPAAEGAQAQPHRFGALQAAG